MQLNRINLALLVSTLALSTRLMAIDISPLVNTLGSENENERASAIEGIRKMGEAAREPLMKVTVTETLKPQQLLLVNKLIGELLIAKSTLKPVDATPLVPFAEDKEKGVKGNPDLLVDTNQKIIGINGEFTLEQGPLEYLVVSKGPNAKLHECVLAAYPKPSDICFALMACNFTFAENVNEEGKINLPKEAGAMLSIEFDWEPAHAKLGDPNAAAKKTRVRVPIEYFAWNGPLEQPMKRMPFAFTGSKFERDPNTGKQVFVADIEKSLIAIKFDQYAVMNTLLDTKDIDPQHAAGYSVNRFVVPVRGTKCRLYFEPWTGGVLTPMDLKDTVAGPKPK